MMRVEREREKKRKKKNRMMARKMSTKRAVNWTKTKSGRSVCVPLYEAGLLMR